MPFQALQQTRIECATESTPGTEAGTGYVPLLANVVVPEYTPDIPVAEGVAAAASVITGLTGEQATAEITIPAVFPASAVRGTTGAPVSPPAWDVLMRACGWDVADSLSNTTRTYSLADIDAESCTISFFLGNVETQLVGCVGTMSATIADNGNLNLTFSMTGAINSAKLYKGSGQAVGAVETAYSAFTRLGGTHALMSGGTLFDLSGGRVPSWTFTQGAAVTRNTSTNSTDGYAAAQLTHPGETTATLGVFRRAATGTEQDPIVAAMRGGAAVSLASTFSADGATITFNTGDCRMHSPANGDSNGVATTTYTIQRSGDLTTGPSVVLVTPTI